MGSGLIWAGLGKGISDAGSAVGSAMMADLREQRLLERQAALEELRETNRVAREERQAQQRMQQAEQATTMADEMGRQRTEADISAGASRAAGNAAQMPGASPAASEAEIRELIKANPQAREQYAKAGLISEPMTRNQERLQRAEDEYSAATRIGAHSTVLESFDKKRARVLEEIRLENSEKRNDQRHQEVMAQQERLGKQFETTSRISQQNADANMIRANRPAAGGADGAAKVRSTYTDDQGNKVAVMSNGETKVLGRAGDFDKSVANLISKMAKDDYKFSKLPESEKRAVAIERLTGGAPSDNEKPSAPATPKSDNGIVKSEPGKLPQPKSQQEFSSIPRGTRYMAPDGTIRIKS